MEINEVKKKVKYGYNQAIDYLGLKKISSYDNLKDLQGEGQLIMKRYGVASIITIIGFTGVLNDIIRPMPVKYTDSINRKEIIVNTYKKKLENLTKNYPFSADKEFLNRFSTDTSDINFCKKRINTLENEIKQEYEEFKQTDEYKIDHKKRENNRKRGLVYSSLALLGMGYLFGISYRINKISKRKQEINNH